MLTKVITKLFPDNNYIGFHLELSDGEDIVVNKDYREQFIVGETIATEVKVSIGKKIQADIDDYKTRKALFDTAAYETARVQIDAGVEV